MNQTIDQLRIAYQSWMESQNLALESAEEALCRDALTPLQRTWLMRFIQLWDATSDMPSPHMEYANDCPACGGDVNQGKCTCQEIE